MGRKALNHDVVLKAAISIANENGLEKVTLASLAQFLDVKTPSLYNHINGLKGLRRDMALYGLKALKETVTNALVGKSGEAAILELGFAYVDFVREHPGLYEATFPHQDIIDDEVNQVSEEIVGLILRIFDVYDLAKEDVLHIVRGLRSIAHGFATLELKQGFAMLLDRNESFKRLLITYIAGLKSQYASI